MIKSGFVTVQEKPLCDIFFAALIIYNTTLLKSHDPAFYLNIMNLSKTAILDIVIAVCLLVITALLIMRVYDDRNDLLSEEEEQFRGCYSEYFANPKHADGEEESALKSIQEVKEPADNEVIFLFIYHNQCGHCDSFKPTWKRLCRKYHNSRINSKTVRFLMIGNDHDEALWNTASTHYQVTGFPTVMVIKKGEEPTEYTGPRTDLEVWKTNINKLAA